MVPAWWEADKWSCPRPQLKVQQTWEEDTAVPTPPQLLAVAQGQGAGQVLRTQHFSYGRILPFSPLPSCPFHHTEFFILGEFSADRKPQAWELLLFYHSSEGGTDG